MNFYIYYYRLLDYDGIKMTIGGVQTYIQFLAKLANSQGYDVHIFQNSNRCFDQMWNNVNITGIPDRSRYIKDRVKNLVSFSMRLPGYKEAIKVFGADHFSIKFSDPKSISIQHGISWDLPKTKISNQWLKRIIQIRDIWRAKNNFENCFNKVCVDYNFLNWYRALFPYKNLNNVWVIPNFSEVSNWAVVEERRTQLKNHHENKIRLLFARRFFDYRGTRLISDVFDKLLYENPNVHITFAGEGPDHEFLRERYGSNNRVIICSYGQDEMRNIHFQHDIAVVPSIGSEGTSFSVIEAMANGCAVIATDVGGITNLIIDGYNGFLAQPTVESLYEKLNTLVNDNKTRDLIRHRAWAIVFESFSLSVWQQKWKSVINEIAKR